MIEITPTVRHSEPIVKPDHGQETCYGNQIVLKAETGSRYGQAFHACTGEHIKPCRGTGYVYVSCFVPLHGVKVTYCSGQGPHSPRLHLRLRDGGFDDSRPIRHMLRITLGEIAIVMRLTSCAGTILFHLAVLGAEFLVPPSLLEVTGADSTLTKCRPSPFGQTMYC